MAKTLTIDEMHELLEGLETNYHLMHSDELPELDLYMDQVVTYLWDQIGGLTRRPGEDKILTKTMINNYTKAGLLNPPDKKKYNNDHLVSLIYIYMFKNFLSISDVKAVLDPVREVCFTEEEREGKAPKKGEEEKKAPLEFTKVYDVIRDSLSRGKKELEKNISEEIDSAAETFEDADPSLRPMLQQFAAVCRISADIYMKKLFLERLIDASSDSDSTTDN